MLISSPAISDEVVGAPNEGKPEHVIFVYEFVKVLIEKENCRAHETEIQQIHFALTHVRHNQTTRYFSGEHAKR